MPTGTINFRLFGTLHSLRRERGLPTTVTFEVPEEGITGADLASALDLPLDLVEGVFRNHTVGPVSQRLYPGDEVALVPEGTPGPHRFFLGLYKAGHETDRDGDESG